MTGTGAPIIVTATFGGADFAFFDGLRRRHFPPERNLVPAHLTLFHHLPPSLEGELKHRLAGIAAGAPPKARLAGLFSLGKGVAFRVESSDLEAIRDMLCEAFAGMLTPQDQAPWRPHVTIQNKADPDEAKRLLKALEANFEPRPLAIAGLASWYYRDGPWEALSEHRFRG